MGSWENAEIIRSSKVVELCLDTHTELRLNFVLRTREMTNVEGVKESFVGVFLVVLASICMVSVSRG